MLMNGRNVSVTESFSKTLQTFMTMIRLPKRSVLAMAHRRKDFRKM
jgi:hypothetical protein